MYIFTVVLACLTTGKKKKKVFFGKAKKSDVDKESDDSGDYFNKTMKTNN